MGKQRQLMVGQRTGKYYAGAYLSGNQSLYAGHMSCSVVNQAAATLIGLNGSTSYTGLAIQNPTGSGYNLSISKVCAVSPVIGAAIQSWGLATNTGTFTPGENTGAGLTIANNFIGAAVTNNVAVASAAATVVATGQVIVLPLVANQIAAGNITGVSYDVEDGIILPPGHWLGFINLGGTPTASNFIGSFFWQQLPV